MELKPELRSIHRKQSWNVVFTQSHYVVLMAWCSPQSLCSPWSTGPPISIPYISGCQTVGLLVRVSIPAQNMMTKRQVVEERFYSAYTSTFLFITKGSQDWNSSRSGSWIWCRGHGGMFLTGFLSLACSACFLIEPKTTSPGMASPTRGPPPLITNWENALQLDHMEAFPQEKLFSVW